jgi:hypothetical protein
VLSLVALASGRLVVLAQMGGVLVRRKRAPLPSDLSIRLPSANIGQIDLYLSNLSLLNSLVQKGLALLSAKEVSLRPFGPSTLPPVFLKHPRYQFFKFSFCRF